MFKSRLLAGVALATLCLPVATLTPGMPFGTVAAQAQSVSFQLFFDQLEPHGVWVRHARYNYVFCPTGIDASWRPYSQGRWLYIKDRGWYFASDEPFAWATYHYGRWFADPDLGWCWVPGTKWAPAWVSWRRSDAVIGWAPLPPEGDGYAVSIEVSRRDLPEGYWVFVPTERFVEPDLSVSIVFGSQQPEYFTQTQFLGPVVVEGDLVVNNVIEVNYIEEATGQQVIAYEPAAAADPAAQSVNVEAQAVTIFDQDVAEPTEEVAPPEAVEETEAAATIESEGGTAGATAEIAAETESGTEEAAPDAADPNAPATAEPAAGEEAAPDQPAAEEPACAPEVMVDGKCPPAADEAEQDQQAPAEPAPTETAPAPTEAPAPDAAPAADAGATPEAEPAADAEAAPVTEPAAEAETAPEAAPAETEAAPTEDAAPAETEAAPAEDAATPKKPPCPPEEMVDGKCPPLPGEEPAQQ